MASRRRRFDDFNGGTLALTIIEAKGLPKMDTGLFSSGKADPYCKVIVKEAKGEREVFKTSVKSKTLEPKWDESVQVQLGQVDTGVVELRLFDKDRLSSDDPMGCIRLQLKDVTSPDETDTWLSIEPGSAPKAQGEVRIKFTFAANIVQHMRANDTVSLSRGTLRIGLGWEKGRSRRPVDLDASCVVFDTRGEFLDCAYFGRLQIQGITHMGDCTSGDAEFLGDDEAIIVDLGRIDRRALALFVVVNAYLEGSHFADVEQGYCRVVQNATSPLATELCRFSLDMKGPHTAMVLCRIARGPDGDWQLLTLGNVDFECRNFGVMVPQLKESLSDLVPGVRVNPRDAVSVVRKGEEFKVADLRDDKADVFTFGLAWDLTDVDGDGRGDNIDLDASAICLDERLRPVDVVYYGQLRSKDKAIKHGGDEREGDEKGDDEKIHVNLAKINPAIKYIGFVINSYSGQPLRVVKDVRCHLFESDTFRDVCRLDITGCKRFSKTALVVCCLYCTSREDWYFRAIVEQAGGRTAMDNIDELQLFLKNNQLRNAKDVDTTDLIRSIFNIFDTNKNGVLEKEEFFFAMTTLAWEIGELNPDGKAAFEEAFDLADTSKDGLVSFNEYAAHIYDLMSASGEPLEKIGKRMSTAMGVLRAAVATGKAPSSPRRAAPGVTVVGARGVKSAPLPEGWESAEDASTGKTYYFHVASGKVQWDPPSAAPPPPPPPPVRVEDRLVVLPTYWEKVTADVVDKNGDGRVSFDEAGEAASQRVPVKAKKRKAVADLVEKTWKDTVTRDRKDPLCKFEVVQVVRNENAKLWRSYYSARKAIAEECSRRSNGFRKQHVKTGPDEAGAAMEEVIGQEALALQDDLNEFYLFHGTKPSAATAICETDFCTSRAGSAVGTMYGPGIYLAECSSKSDEYAKDDDEGPYAGLFAMLLCRATLGECYYTDAVRPPVERLVQAVQSGSHHSVLGDREKARGTYREFVVFDADLIYPEYIILYRREHPEEH